MGERFPGKRLSVLRLLLMTVAIAVLGILGFGGWTYTQVNQSTADRWFGGYIDVTATPSYPFESLSSTSHRNQVLSFIVADGDRCAPSWGGYYTPEEAAEALDLDRRVARVVENGHEIVLSFGGMKNSSLAAVCTSDRELAGLYERLLIHYDSNVIDLDIENDDLSDVASRHRRVAAVLEVQQRFEDRGEHLGVWLTLPAARTGLTADGAAVVEEFIDAGVALSGVNLMVMNFGVPTSETSQADLSVEALRAGHAQLRNLFWTNGELYSNEQLWRRLGATPMIGQNDLESETFTLQDARQLRTFANEVGLGRLSFWSLNRDEPCEANYPNQTVVATFCSGIGQASGQFAEILSENLNGSASAFAADTRGDAPQDLEPIVDDPATSPYPIWEERSAYPADTKVVWRGNVYASLWWNRGAQPDAPAGSEGTPWRLIGPVLPGDKPIVQPTLPEGFYAAWDPSTIFHRGDRVMHEGKPYEAKWWSQGDSPDAGTADPGSSPWQPLSSEQITELLEPPAG